MKPRLLDLFCGAGGAGMGYHQAGFEVVGVDIEPQPRYPFEFHQADAVALLEDLIDGWPCGTIPGHLDEFDAIHASPPCQDHTELAFGKLGRRESHGTGWMLAAMIEQLPETGLPYVIENVPRAHMPGAFILCGRSFGIERLKRHRKFLVDFPVLVPPCACSRKVRPVGVYGDLSKNDRSMGRNPDGYRRTRAGVATARELLGCPWMEAAELSQAIPPAYTRFIGEQLIAHLSTLDSRSVGVPPIQRDNSVGSGTSCSTPADRV
jgi:DNA (cytosine-5)-methyltransferase 1